MHQCKRNVVLQHIWLQSYYQKVYNKNVDVWSVGVILYQLLNKVKIKNNKNMEKFIQQITFKNGSISLFQRMTEFDSTKRYSAFQALLHPWIDEKRQVIPQNFTEMFDLWLLTQKSILFIQGLMIIIHLKNNVKISIQKYHTLSDNQSKFTKTDVSDDNQDSSLTIKLQIYQTSQNKTKIQKSKQSDYSSTNISPIMIKSIERQENNNGDQLFLHNLLPDLKIAKEYPERSQKVQIKRLDSSLSQNTKNSSSSSISPQKCCGNKQMKFLLKPLPTQNDLQKETQTVDLYKIQYTKINLSKSNLDINRVESLKAIHKD